MKFRIAALGLAFFAISGVAHAEGDAAAGEKVFKKCAACHAIADDKNKVGPSLKGVINRPAASVASYKYSPAMIKKGEEGLIWDEATLTEYLPKPMKYVPGTKMGFAGLNKPEDIENIIAYLKQNSQ